MTHSDRSVCAIHLFGKMNPSLHYPIWYKYQELISEEEEKHALEVGQAMMLPFPQPLSRFEVGTFRVMCDLNRWEISANHINHLPRICQVSGKLFDRILPHTPVKEITLQLEYIFTLPEDERRAIARRTADAVPFDLALTNPEFTELSVVDRRGDIAEAVKVRSRVDTPEIQVVTSYTFTKKDAGGKVSYWTIEEHLGANLPRLEEKASGRAGSIINKLRG